MSSATLERKALKDALAVACAVVPSRSVIPAILNVRMRGSKGSVEIAATDLEHSVQLRVPRLDKGNGDFAAIIPGRRLAEHVRASKGSETSIEVDGLMATLDGSAKLTLFPPEEFPELADLSAKSEFSAPAGAFAEALPRVLFAVSTEVVRYALTGVCLEAKKGALAFVASDGKRLSVAKIGDAKGQARIIVPEKSAQVLARLAERAKSDSRITASIDEAGSFVSFKIGDSILNSRLIEGHFPDYDAVVPMNAEHRFDADPRELAAAVLAARSVSTDKTRAVRFTVRGNALEIFARTQDVGERKELIDIYPLKGSDGFSAVYNPDYVLDYLKSLPKGCKVSFGAENKEHAALWWVLPEKRTHYVLMPLTVNL